MPNLIAIKHCCELERTCVEMCKRSEGSFIYITLYCGLTVETHSTINITNYHKQPSILYTLKTYAKWNLYIQVHQDTEIQQAQAPSKCHLLQPHKPKSWSAISNYNIIQRHEEFIDKPFKKSLKLN